MWKWMRTEQTSKSDLRCLDQMTALTGMGHTAQPDFVHLGELVDLLMRMETEANRVEFESANAQLVNFEWISGRSGWDWLIGWPGSRFRIDVRIGGRQEEK